MNGLNDKGIAFNIVFYLDDCILKLLICGRDLELNSEKVDQDSLGLQKRFRDPTEKGHSGSSFQGRKLKLGEIKPAVFPVPGPRQR